MENLKANITLSAPRYGDGREVVCIEIQDDLSRIKFLTVELSYANFAKMLTGLGSIDCNINLKQIDNVGKIRENRTIVFEIPKEYGYCPSALLKELSLKHIPDGWNSDMYFSSKDSRYIDKETGKAYGRFNVYRYVDIDGEQ